MVFYVNFEVLVLNLVKLLSDFESETARRQHKKLRFEGVGHGGRDENCPKNAVFGGRGGNAIESKIF